VNSVFCVIRDLLREALARRWFLALGLAATLAIVVLALSLRLEVVDGALAATRLFDSSLHHGIRAADVTLRPVYAALALTLGRNYCSRAGWSICSHCPCAAQSCSLARFWE
jgi:hypothetical protein